MEPAGRNVAAAAVVVAVAAAKPERLVRPAATPVEAALCCATAGAQKRAIKGRHLSVRNARNARNEATGPRAPIGLRGATRSSDRNAVLWTGRSVAIAASRAPAAASGATDEPAAADRRAKGRRERPAGAPNRAGAGIGATDDPAAADRRETAENLAVASMPADAASGATDVRQTKVHSVKPESPADALMPVGAASGVKVGPAAADQREKASIPGQMPAGAASGVTSVPRAAGPPWMQPRVLRRCVPMPADAASGASRASRAGTAAVRRVRATKAEQRGAAKPVDAASAAMAAILGQAAVDPRRAPMLSLSRGKAIAGCASRLPLRACRPWDDRPRLRLWHRRQLPLPHPARGQPAWRWRGRSRLLGPRWTG